MKKLLIAVCSLLSISLLGGCSVRELPEDGGVDPTIVHTEIVLLPGADMTPFDVPEFSTRAADPREYKVWKSMPMISSTKACNFAANSFVMREIRRM